jgi:hypothetical protein
MGMRSCVWVATHLLMAARAADVALAKSTVSSGAP